jgi:DNA-binding NarL/FixJ family response regulator
MSAQAHVRDSIQLLIATEVRLYREGLAHGLARHEGLSIVGAAANGDETIAAAQRLQPAVVLLDMSMARSTVLVGEIVNVSPGTKVVAFAVAGDESDVIAYAEAGVSGYVPRDGSITDLVAAVEGAANGEALCSPRVAARAFRRLAALSAAAPRAEDSPRLTAREQEVVALIDEGLSNKQIARRLYITLATVKNHVHNVLEKLHVERRGEAAAVLRSRRRTSQA